VHTHKKQLLLVMILPVLALLAAAGMFFWYQNQKVADAVAAAEAQAALPKYVYVQMPDFKVPAVQGGRGQVELKLTLEVVYAAKDEVEHEQARLGDAFSSDLYAYLGEGNKIVPGKVENLDEVKARLRAVAVRETNGKVHDVLIQPVSHLWENTGEKKKKEKEEE
jgi:flagellar basal body-associated protein FliL